MLTMQKEKVNTHFSFPMKLDMSGYVEKTLLPQQCQESKAETIEDASQIEPKSTMESELMDSFTVDDTTNEQYEYSLIGVTVHTGNADGGHYYSFIKERNGPHPHAPDRWFLFNDAEVKQFDPSQIEAECFGGEMTSKTYDTVTEKYLDFSFEKTNSAYMLFYERVSSHQSNNETQSDQSSSDENIKTEDSYEQAGCSTTSVAATAAVAATTSTTSVKKIVDFNRMDESFENDPVPCRSDENQDEITSTPTPTLTPPATTNTSTEKPTHTMNDELTIEHNKCDIDTNSDGKQNADKTVDGSSVQSALASTSSTKKTPTRHLLSKELEEWIWEDNRYFLQDRNIFEHTYFK